MKFLVDAQLPPALARTLSEMGYEAVAVADVGLRDAKDSEIWAYAIENESAIITKDEDFAERCVVSKSAPAIVWLRLGNSTNRQLLEWLIPIWDQVIAQLEAGDRVIEVR